jgi:phage shock protein PspC (stress-responsive transcriptional regulator)
MAKQRLTRDLEHAMLGGVLAGMARQWNIDATVLRLIALILIIPSGGLVIPVYLVAWLIIPRPDQVEPAEPAAESPSLRERLDPGRWTEAAREAGDTARRASERMAEAAHLAQEAARTAADAARAAADAARTAAEEITDITHQRRTEGRPGGSASAGGDATAQRPAPEPADVPESEDAPPPSGYTGATSSDGVDIVEGQPADQLAAEEQPVDEAQREQGSRP